MTETLQEEAPSDDPTAVNPLNRSLSKRRDKQYGLATSSIQAVSLYLQLQATTRVTTKAG